MKRLVKLTFAVPIDDKRLLATSRPDKWLRLSDTVVLVDKNHWLETGKRMQPHRAKEITCL